MAATSSTNAALGHAREAYGIVGSQRYNGSAWDDDRNNAEVTVLSSASRTATANSSDQTNYNAKGVRFWLDIDDVTGTTPTLDVKVQGKDPVSDNYVDIPGAAFAQKTDGEADSTDDLVIYPGVAETANRSVSDVIPRTWRVVATIAGTSPDFTFSVGACYLN